MKIIEMLFLMFLAFLPFYFLAQFLTKKINNLRFRERLTFVKELLIKPPTIERYKQLCRDFNDLRHFNLDTEEAAKELLDVYETFILKYQRTMKEAV